MILHDTFTVDGVRRTGDGYLTAYARVARTGIQTYRGHELGRPDMETIRVYRPPEEVFAPDAMKSFAHRPITLKHPPTPVTAGNWKKYAGGQTGEDVVRDGDFVRVPMVMMDAALIDAYEKDGIRELSMGYSTDIQWRSGVTDAGEEYDAVQTSIRANHLALVPVARGGDKLRVGDNSDSSLTSDGGTCPKCGAEMKGKTCPDCNYTKDGELQMKTMVIDGLTVNVADDQSAAIIQRALDAAAKAVADAAADFEKMKKEKADKEEACDAATKSVSAKDGEIAVLKQQLKDAEITPEKLDVLVKDRQTVVDAAAKLLGKEFAFDGKSVSDIKRAAVSHKLGDAAKDMDDAAVGGAFAALSAGATDKGGTTPIRDAMMVKRTTVANDERTTAHDEYVRSLSEGWRGSSSTVQ